MLDKLFKYLVLSIVLLQYNVKAMENFDEGYSSCSSGVQSTYASDNENVDLGDSLALAKLLSLLPLSASGENKKEGTPLATIDLELNKHTNTITNIAIKQPNIPGITEEDDLELQRALELSMLDHLPNEPSSPINDTYQDYKKAASTCLNNILWDITDKHLPTNEAQTSSSCTSVSSYNPKNYISIDCNKPGYSSQTDEPKDTHTKLSKEPKSCKRKLSFEEANYDNITPNTKKAGSIGFSSAGFTLQSTNGDGLLLRLDNMISAKNITLNRDLTSLITGNLYSSNPATHITLVNATLSNKSWKELLKALQHANDKVVYLKLVLKQSNGFGSDHVPLLCEFLDKAKESRKGDLKVNIIHDSLFNRKDEEAIRNSLKGIRSWSFPGSY